MQVLQEAVAMETMYSCLGNFGTSADARIVSEVENI